MLEDLKRIFSPDEQDIEENRNHIDENRGNVVNNYGAVKTNRGIVENNYGRIDVNKKIATDNYGLIDSNDGIIENNYGRIETNHGTIIRDYGIILNNLGNIVTNRENEEDIVLALKDPNGKVVYYREDDEIYIDTQKFSIFVNQTGDEVLIAAVDETEEDEDFEEDDDDDEDFHVHDPETLPGDEFFEPDEDDFEEVLKEYKHSLLKSNRSIPNIIKPYPADFEFVACFY